jgi:hypothetical protein
MGQVGAASHKVRQGLQTTGLDGSAREHHELGWPVDKKHGRTK